MPSKHRLDFARRAVLSERMDEPCTYEEFRGCLRDLARVNRVTLAYRPTLHWLRRLRRQHPGRTEPWHIVDVGSGQGDMLRRVAQWAARAGVPVRLTGVDLNPHAAQAAKEAAQPGESIDWVSADIFCYSPPAAIDVVLSSLFTHHLPDTAVVRFLQWMEENARLGWFINDLHRARAPFHLFRGMARLARWHPFVQHDGPISILRAFSGEDWHGYLLAAGLERGTARVEPFRPARLCVGRIK